MAGIVENLSVVQRFLVVLTWKKNLQFFVFLLIIGLSWATFENREKIYNFANQTKLTSDISPTKKLSKSSADKIDETVEKSELIVGIQITLVDFQRNTRHEIYTSIDNVDLKDIYTRYMHNTIADGLPLFNSDVVNNRRLVELINGEYSCNPFSETLISRIIPETLKYVNTVCANGIPPFYGKFSAIISIFLRRAPTDEEIDQVRTLARILSLEIHDKDLR